MPIDEKLRADFAKRYGRFCAHEEDVPHDELVIPCRSVVRLAASAKQPSARAPIIKSTNDIDELKSWIGVPNLQAKRECQVEREHSREMAEIRKLLDTKAARSEQDPNVEEAAATKASGPRGALMTRLRASPNAGAKFDAIRAHARAYLYGNSSNMASAKPVLEAVFAPFKVIVWLFPKVIVRSGATLVFGTGANVLTASELEIEQGGQVVSHGSLTVHVSNLKKTKPFTIHTPIGLEHLALELGHAHP
jgi:hypothetical protein